MQDLDGDSFKMGFNGVEYVTEHERFNSIPRSYAKRRREFRKVTAKAKAENEPWQKLVEPDAYQIFGADIDELLKFVESTGNRLLFCLNSLLGVKQKKKWNSTNAFQFVDYLKSRSYSAIDFSMGNEPQSRTKVTGSRSSEDGSDLIGASTGRST